MDISSSDRVARLAQRVLDDQENVVHDQKNVRDDQENVDDDQKIVRDEEQEHEKLKKLAKLRNSDQIARMVELEARLPRLRTRLASDQAQLQLDQAKLQKDQAKLQADWDECYAAGGAELVDQPEKIKEALAAAAKRHAPMKADQLQKEQEPTGVGLTLDTVTSKIPILPRWVNPTAWRR